MTRRVIVRIVAFTLRRNLNDDDMMWALTRAFPHRDSAWRMAVLSDAQARNERRRKVTYIA